MSDAGVGGKDCNFAYLEIAMDHSLFVHVINSLEDLPDQVGRVFLRVRSFLDDAIKQFAASDPVNIERRLFNESFHYKHTGNKCLVCRNRDTDEEEMTYFSWPGPPPPHHHHIGKRGFVIDGSRWRPLCLTPLCGSRIYIKKTGAIPVCQHRGYRLMTIRTMRDHAVVGITRALAGRRFVRLTK